MDKMLPEQRETYWGSIETARRWPVAMKRIIMRAGTQSSLEFHTRKHEIYWVLSGRLKVGVRYGRAINDSIELSPGECLYLKPGDMHMRIALEDTIIMEACAFDDDADTHFVEDGKTYRHMEAVNEIAA